jgi:hypothetical protein
LAHGQEKEEAVAEAEEASRENVLAGWRMGDAQVHEKLVRGTFHLNPEWESGRTDIVGFLAVHGRIYRLKAGNERVCEELTKRAGKVVSLEGEIRNRGKYFIAHRFAAALPPAVSLRNQKGL